MKSDSDDLPPLVDTGTPLEQQLLRLAQEDAPSPEWLERLGQIEEIRVLRAPTRLRSSWALAALTVPALAAAWFLVPSSRGIATPSPAAESRQVTPAGAVRVPAPNLRPPLCPVRAVGGGQDPRIDDFEDGNSRVLLSEGRDGFWFTQNDGTGKQVPEVGGLLIPQRSVQAGGKPRYGLSTRGTGFSGWGATLGVLLVEAGCYDASAYRGIEVRIRGPGRLLLGLQTFDVIPESDGGSCRKDCYANHATALELSSKFETKRVLFSELEQPSFGTQVEFDSQKLRSILFTAAPADGGFAFTIDELSFVR